jgi:AcrR family transcriptional regulator
MMRELSIQSPASEAPGLRAAIRRTALSLFEQRGVDAVSVAEICRAADVANGSFYNFFRSKDALIADLLDETQRELAKSLATVQGELATPREAHRRDVTLIVDFVEQHWALFRLALTTHARPGMRGSLVDLFHRQRAEELRRGIAAGRLRGDLIPEVAAAVEVGLMTETLSWWARNRDAMARETLIDQLTAIRTRITHGADPA